MRPDCKNMYPKRSGFRSVWRFFHRVPVSENGLFSAKRQQNPHFGDKMICRARCVRRSAAPLFPPPDHPLSNFDGTPGFPFPYQPLLARRAGSGAYSGENPSRKISSDSRAVGGNPERKPFPLSGCYLVTRRPAPCGGNSGTRRPRRHFPFILPLRSGTPFLPKIRAKG